jgi:hypothetical protein
MGRRNESFTVTADTTATAVVWMAGDDVADGGGLVVVGGMVEVAERARRSPRTGSRGWRRELAGKLETATILPRDDRRVSRSTAAAVGRRRG